MRFFASLACLALLLTPSAFAAECGMSKAFDQPDRDRRGGVAPVWRDDASGPKAPLLFGGSLHVNTDGTKRSYSVADFWGAAHAINNLCNAMDDACAGLSKAGLQARRIATQKALADGWPADELRASHVSRDIIPFKNGRPCPLLDGYLVSATALTDGSKPDVCDIHRYLDALHVPALVLPGRLRHKATGFELNGAAVGDLLVAMVPGKAQLTYAVVGDSGPPTALGEGSVALNGALNQMTREPVNYKDVKTHWDVGNAVVLLFPRSREGVPTYLTPDRIHDDGQTAFRAWGGGSEQGAIARLQACAAAYRASGRRP